MNARPISGKKWKSDELMLTYYYTGSLSVPVSGLAVANVCSANGLYDPEITGTGTQPDGFAREMIEWEHYTVMKSAIIVNFRNYTEGAAPQVFIGVRADSAVITSPTVNMEMGDTASDQLAPGSSAGSKLQLRNVCKVAHFLGIPKLLDSSVARGDLNNNPAEGAFFHIGAFNDEVAQASTVQFKCWLKYWVVFTEPKNLTVGEIKMVHDLRKQLVLGDGGDDEKHANDFQIPQLQPVEEDDGPVTMVSPDTFHTKPGRLGIQHCVREYMMHGGVVLTRLVGGGLPNEVWKETKCSDCVSIAVGQESQKRLQSTDVAGVQFRFDGGICMRCDAGC